MIKMIISLLFHVYNKRDVNLRRFFFNDSQTKSPFYTGFGEGVVLVQLTLQCT